LVAAGVVFCVILSVADQLGSHGTLRRSFYRRTKQKERLKTGNYLMNHEASVLFDLWCKAARTDLTWGLPCSVCVSRWAALHCCGSHPSNGGTVPVLVPVPAAGQGRTHGIPDRSGDGTPLSMPLPWTPAPAACCTEVPAAARAARAAAACLLAALCTAAHHTHPVCRLGHALPLTPSKPLTSSLSHPLGPGTLSCPVVLPPRFAARPSMDARPGPAPRFALLSAGNPSFI
jgi:hypothetical protein